MTEEQREIRELARDFAESEIRPRAAAWDRDGAFDREVLDKLAGLGFLGMLVPETYGGLGLDVPTYVVALEELARGDASLALTVAIQNGPVPRLLLTHGTEAQKSRWLPVLASGKTLAGVALSEDRTGSDPSALTTVARKEDGGWTITGSKRWVTNGRLADLVVVFARTSPDPADPTPKLGTGSVAAEAVRSPGASLEPHDAREHSVDPADGRSSGRSRPSIGAFLVDTVAEGYRVGKRETTMGFRASETVAVELEGVRVDADRFVGDRSRGSSHALAAAQDVGRLGIGAQAVGIAQAALEHAIRYAGERRQFGRPIAAFGAVRGKLAGMATRIAAARALVLEAARGWEAVEGRPGFGAGEDDGLSVTAWSAMAKLLASETASWVTDEAVHIFGGYGYMREFPVERLLRDAKGTEIYEGTSEILRVVIGRSLTGIRRMCE